VHRARVDNDDLLVPTYADRKFFAHDVPKYRLTVEGMPADAAYQLVHDELNLDGNPLLNLASFVTTWMEPEGNKLALETMSKNLVDQDEYPQTELLHQRVVAILGRLLNVPGEPVPIGTATVGSSEAIMLGLLAHKRSWQLRRQAEGKPADRPNLIFGADVHTCWEKFTRYFEVEARVVPLEPDRYTLRAQDVADRVDESTIAVGGLLGTTFTGQMDELEQINDLLAELERDRGWRIPLHVDAASGGFIIPFSQPDLKWDFRLSHVRSINVSNHKFGLVYPGMGTVIFRERADVPDDLVFRINYLGGDMPNYSLNFSRPSSSVVLQYFNFLRLGHSGYERIVHNVLANAQSLARRAGASDALELINDGSRFPVVVVRAADPQRLDLSELSRRLRCRGWIVPAYTLPANAEHISVLRMVVKENFSRDMVDMLGDDLDDALADLLGAKPTARKRRAAAARPIC
jgi:glutamate decarboxylase